MFYIYATLHVKRCSSIITLVTLVDLETIYYAYIYIGTHQLLNSEFFIINNIIVYDTMVNMIHNIRFDIATAK